jgi:AGZA family xanthine/uracil permease-like MFS transporter
MPFVFRTFAFPIIGLVTFGIILLTYFGNVRFKGGLPGGFVAVAVGTGLAWAMGIAPVTGAEPTAPGWHPPIPVLSDIWDALSSGYAVTYLSIIIPMGVFNLLGSLQNIESAEAAGDAYPTAPSLAVNGLGTLAAAAFGSCFPTTIYIGHPGWKAMGARAGYSVLNGVFFTIICLTGLLSTIQWAIPIEAGMAIVLYIGIVISAQAFQTTPVTHAPAVVIGIIPGVAAWGTLMATQSLAIAGFGRDRPITDATIQSFQAFDNWINGAFALTEGFVLSSMILAATVVMIIERKFRIGACWCLAASMFSILGLMHSYRLVGAQSTMSLFEPAWPWAIGYALFGVLLFVTPWITEPDDPDLQHGRTMEEYLTV